MGCFKRCAGAVLLSSVMVFAVVAQSAKTPALFTVNNKPVSIEEFVYLYRKNHQHKPEEFTREKIEEYLDLFINYKLKVEEALSRGMDTTASFRQEYAGYRDELLKPYLPDSKVLDSLVALTYERLAEEVNASHILIRLEPAASPADTLAAFKKILDLRSQALAGEDFGELAAQYSEEPGARQSRGNLGYFTAMQMVFPFEQAAYMTPVGNVSAPVRTQFGYHILKVNDRRPSRGEVEVSHIMIKSTEPSDDEARNRIFDIYDKLQKGMNWEEVCMQYSEDTNTKESGGRLRPFGVGAMASVPQFQEMAFALDEVGEISDPVQTRYGWHILRLESKIPLPPFQELKPALTQRVSRDERVHISNEALRLKMREAFRYTENAATKEKLLNNAENILSGNMPVFSNEPLFQMQDRDYTVKGFIDFLFAQPKATSTNEAFLEQRLTQYVDHVQRQLLEEKIKRESPDYAWLLKEYYEGILLFEIMETEVWNKAMEDSVGQRQYFERNSTKYKAGERALAKIYSGTSADAIKELKGRLSENDAVGALVTSNRIRVDSGAFEKNERPVLSKIPWESGVHEASSGGSSYLVEVRQIIPPGPETFEEARASVISDYQTYLEDSWISELKRKFGVRVDKKAKKRAFEQLIDQKK